jgi:hypothetical protein
MRRDASREGLQRFRTAQRNPPALRATASCCWTSCMVMPLSVAAAIKSRPAFRPNGRCADDFPASKASAPGHRPKVSSRRSSFSSIGGVGLRVRAIASEYGKKRGVRGGAKRLARPWQLISNRKTHAVVRPLRSYQIDPHALLLPHHAATVRQALSSCRAHPLNRIVQIARRHINRRETGALGRAKPRK